MVSGQDAWPEPSAEGDTWERLSPVLAQLQKYRLVVEHTHNMVVITDAHKRIEYVNPAYTEVTGWALDDVRGLKPGRLLQGPATDPQTVRKISQALSQGRAVRDVELVNYNQRGEPYWVSLNIQPVRNEAGAITHFVAVECDVTERRRARESLQASERRLAEALRVARMGSFECDLASDTLIWSSDAATVLGCAPQALPARYVEHVLGLHEDDREALMDVHWGMLSEHRPYEIEYRLMVGDAAGYRWIRERGAYLPADDQAPERLSALVQDISATKAAHERAEYLASHDTLTGLINRDQLRAVLRTRLREAQDAGSPLALLCVDLDRFKAINDTLGHPVGDEVLQQVARRLRDSVRSSDVLARLGGDEFVLLLSGVDDPCVVSRLTSKILARLAVPMVHDGRDLHVTACAGISLHPQDGHTAEELMRHADAALHQAKSRGPHTLSFYCAQTNALSEERYQIERGLRQAHQRQELCLHYQPQFDRTGTRLIGFEALLRWQPSEGPPIGPDRFIPVAESCGLIGAMGAWVLDEACRQWRAWWDGLQADVRLAVNISAHQLRADQDLPALIAHLLQRYDIPPDRLELELTETVAMHDPAASIELMRRLRQLGVSLAIDDFGTGYSSLSYLKTLPIQRIKLDRSFVKDIDVDPDDKAICCATIALAHRLGLEVVAEGVETSSQHAYLSGQGCDLMQGYLLGRPLPAAQAVALIDDPHRSRQHPPS